MANQRLSTIYDYATLRLHRDGTRVQQSDENYHVPRRKQFAIRDASGNWIAKDAGGLGMVNRTRYVKREGDDEEEHVSLGGTEGKGEGETSDEWILLERERTEKKKDHRTEKRRRFEENLDFLDISHNASSASTSTQACLPVPSSELLKSIHYFTAEFYAGRGELLDLGKKYREERNVRERSRYATGKGKRVRIQESEEEEDLQSEQESSDVSESMTKTSYRPANTRRDTRKKHKQDMYKVMDGTALMALGMLVQEHVARLVQGVPDRLEEEMQETDESGEDEVGGSGFDESSDQEAPAEDISNGATGTSETGDDEVLSEAGKSSDDEG